MPTANLPTKPVRPLLEPGDIFAVRGRGPVPWLTRTLMAPPTDRFHFGLVAELADDGDYVILECLGTDPLGAVLPFMPTGVTLATGRLSMYNEADLCYYRPALPAAVRHHAPVAITRWGRAKYDYWLFARLFAGYLRALITNALRGRFRRVCSEELAYIPDGTNMICTEAVVLAYAMQSHPLLPMGTPPTPAALEQAVLDGTLVRL